MKEIYITNILSTTDILISAGSEDGIEEGMILNIVDDNESANNIVNPSTGEVLATIQRFKFMLRVTYTSNNFSRLTTVDDVDVVENDFYGYDQPAMPIADNETVNNIFEKYSHSPIKIGDKVTLD